MTDDTCEPLINIQRRAQDLTLRRTFVADALLAVSREQPIDPDQLDQEHAAECARRGWIAADEHGRWVATPSGEAEVRRLWPLEEVSEEEARVRSAIGSIPAHDVGEL